MKFLKGLIIGSLLGFAVGAALTEQQRKEVAERAARVAKRRVEPVATAVGENAAKVADAATGTVVEKIDDAGDAAADTVGDTPATATTG